MPARGQGTRSLIVDEALALVSEIGFEALTIGRLADEVGMSKSGLFGHFRSKENLQLDVLERAVERFTEGVVAPALGKTRGEPRVRALFDGWLDWACGVDLPGGCVFIAAANEFDDREGPLRDRLAGYQRGWLEGLTRAAGIAVEEGHYRADLDVEQFAYEFYSIVLAFHHASRLLRDERAGDRARAAFERLTADARG